MSYPTPLHPAILIYSGNIPALKNDRKIFTDQQGKFSNLGRSKGVSRWLRLASSSINEQFERQGFDKMEVPLSLGAFTHLGVYMSPKNVSLLPNSDVDNAYTTIQETWAGILIDNDRQVADYHVTRMPIHDPALVHSLVFLWVLDKDRIAEDRFYPIEQFIDFFLNYYKGKLISEIIKQSTQITTG